MKALGRHRLQLACFRNFHGFLSTGRCFGGWSEAELWANIERHATSARKGQESGIGSLLGLPGGLDAAASLCLLLNRIVLNLLLLGSLGHRGRLLRLFSRSRLSQNLRSARGPR